MTLEERIDAAIERITKGQADMRIPAEETDPDLVLADCKAQLASAREQIAAARKVFGDISFRSLAGDCQHVLDRAQRAEAQLVEAREHLEFRRQEIVRLKAQPSIDFPCSRCGAEPGEWCRTVRSKPLGGATSNHAVRVEARDVALAAAQPAGSPRHERNRWLVVAEAEAKLRYLLWAMHPCEGKYGDDGEMQCPCGWEFRRDSVDVIEQKTHEMNLRKLMPQVGGGVFRGPDTVQPASQEEKS